jgi:hypothetical protein
MLATVPVVDSPRLNGESPDRRNGMKLTDLLLAELDREAAGTRSALERVPEGHNDWKPYPESMPLGYLASLVATMPSWIVSMVNHEQLDLKSADAAKFKPLEWRTRAELVSALDGCVAEAREALKNTTDDHLLKTVEARGGRPCGQ